MPFHLTALMTAMFGSIGGSGVPVEIPVQAETTALLARMTTQPSANEQTIYNRLIYDLKQAGIWQKLDGLWVTVSHNSQAAYLNWVSTDYTLTPTSGTYTNYQGWAGNGTTGFLNPGFNPTLVASPKFTQNDASFGAYSMSFGLGTSGNMMGAFDGTQGNQLSPRGTVSSVDNVFRARINSATALDVPGVNNGQGFFCANRSSSTAVQLYRDGVQVGSSNSIASVAPVNQGFTIGRISTSFYSAARCGLAFIGASLDSTQHAAFGAAVQRYMDAMVSLTLTASYAGTSQTFAGGYIEIQPDSYAGGTSVPPTDSTTATWGVPYSLTTSERARLKSLVFPGGNQGIKYIRFPLGFAYRGLRNIDGTSGLARNVGERYAGQNAAIADMISNIVANGGGLAPEYWGVAPHWTTLGKFGGSSGQINTLTAGGSYPRTTSLNSIRGTDATQYNAQIAAISDAFLNDLEHLHTNVGPVRMFGLQNEPQYGNQEYGSCFYTDAVYSDLLAALVPKIRASSVLSTWGGQANTVQIHVASDDTFSIGQTFITNFPGEIAFYTHHNLDTIARDADWIKTSGVTLKGAKANLAINETEYRFPTESSDDFKCANSMLRDLHNLAFTNATISMPIIHAVKQIGAVGINSNTTGYALMEMNLQEPYGTAPGATGNLAPSLDYGTFRPIPHNYNAHLFLGENLRHGAVRYASGITASMLPDGVGFAAFNDGGKLKIFVANRNKWAIKLTVNLPSAKTLTRKVYSLTRAGVAADGVTGSSMTIVVEGFSGSVFTEV